MSIQLTIRQKGLVLISISPVFLLAFLFLAAEKLQRFLVDVESGMWGLVVRPNGSFLQSQL